MREEEYRAPDSSDQSSQAGTAITFLLIGLGAGALLGFLYAPRTGKQMRKELRRQFESVKGTLDDWTGDAKDLAEEALERGVEFVEEFRKSRTAA